ncbi:hypothetical protein HanXRQr2_Chr13g0600931 [Helianthus annuus]|uniref:Uncharacterized protein n=1 Tax=Helianthus annuus TaxID=4232 RepID=A0A251SUN3_HELAN|nr:hypothetical protein HanXRQr2_Chr13g0600931 [Helianthus annuus]KAJ0477833.1 hypothetical protein HanHA300_Chr13g0493071 [Helianthus annuus]KAJ0498663.1 hypothetical protein HanHA89_Chr13g0525181 [Helianthus annuus]KAJ0664676.1 hypothetical protein HanLR1_Chr13g0495171 [Helianthus annuus]KAJ0672127.1 hypothetical protein HanOQP8_Chr13g0493491 [Helianthus annuus]
MEMPNVFHSYLRFKKMRANLHPTALEHPGSRSIGISDRRTNNRISIVAHLHHRQIHGKCFSLPGNPKIGSSEILQLIFCSNQLFIPTPCSILII